MAQGSFSATVSQWVRETKARQTAVFRESAQRTVDVAQTPVSQGGRMRVDTGFLRASLQAVIGDGNFTLRAKPDGAASFAYDAGAVSLVIAKATIIDPITVGYTANYARPREYGARGQAGDRFVGLAAQQFPRIVREVCAEARKRVEG